MKSHQLDPAKSAPTTPWGSGLLYAVAGTAGPVAVIWAIIGGLFAVWRLYIARNLHPPAITGMALVWTAVVGYYLAGAFSAAFFPSDEQSVHQLYERIPFLLLPPLLLLLARSDPHKLLEWSVTGAALGIVFAALYLGATFDPQRDGRAEALSGNANVFGYMHALLILLCCLGLALARPVWIRGLCALSVVLAFGLITLSGSRGALLSGMIVCVVMAWFSGPWRSWWQKAAVLSLVLALAVGVISLTPLAERFANTFRDFTAEKIDYSGTNTARLAMWHCGWSKAWQAPLVGSGHDEALSHLTTCLRDRFNVIDGFTHYHNLFLDQFAKGGLVGLMPVVLLTALPLLLLARWRRRSLKTWAASNQDCASTWRALAGAILSLFAIQMMGSLFNIGLGHDILDTGFIYTFVLLFGVLHAFSMQAQSHLASA